MKWGVRRTPEQLGHKDLVRKYGRAGANRVERYSSGKGKSKYTNMTREQAEATERSAQQKRDTVMYGKKGAARIQKRVDNGRSRASARTQEYATQVMIGIAAAGGISFGVNMAMDPQYRRAVTSTLGSKLHSAANAARDKRAQQAIRDSIEKLASSNARVVFRGDGYDILEGVSLNTRRRR